MKQNISTFTQDGYLGTEKLGSDISELVGQSYELILE